MKKRFFALLCLIVAIGMLGGCGASAKNDSDSAGEYLMDDNFTEAPAADEAESWGGSDVSASFPDAGYGLKLVYNATINLETLDYDKSLADILAALTECGGYVSSQYTDGGYRLLDDRYSTRYAELVLRVPADQYEAFLQGGAAFGNVTSVTRGMDDITTEYIDTEARLNSLQAQEERLLAMLDRAGTLEELLSLEDHLAQIRYEIERYTSTMNAYENMVAYSTVTIYLREVSTITNTSNTFGAQLKNALSGSLRGVVEFLQRLLFFLIYAFPYLILVAGLVLILRKILRARRARRGRGMPTAPPDAGRSPENSQTPLG